MVETVDQDELSRSIQTLWESRCSIIPADEATDVLSYPVYDHRYQVLLTLAINPNVTFSFENLVALMPFDTSVQQLQRQMVLEANRSPAGKAIAIHKRELLMPEGQAKAMVRREIARLERIPPEWLFPGPKDLGGVDLWYFDPTARRRTPLEYDRKSKAILADEKTLTRIYAYPLQFEFTVTRQNQFEPHAENPALAPQLDHLFLARKYTPAFRFLHVHDHFSLDSVAVGIVHRVTLATHADMIRFLFSLPGERGAPTLEEWNWLLGTRGLVTEIVLDILRRRATEGHDHAA